MGRAQPLDLAQERALLRRATQGDRSAIASLYRAFAPRLYREVLMPQLGNRQAAEDALSETFRALIENVHRVNADERSLWSWLCRVAGNKARDMHRVKARTGRALVSFEAMLVPLTEARQQDAAVELERADDRRALRERVAAVLAELNPRYRLALELRFLQDRPRQECAERLEVKLGTFDVLLLRSLRAFHKRWQAMLGTGEGVTP